jgi:hypothetical protein
MTKNDRQGSAEAIEVNLMFAELELTIGRPDGAATERALYHVREALELLRKDIADRQFPTTSS